MGKMEWMVLEEETQLGVECQKQARRGLHWGPHSHDKSETLPQERGRQAWRSAGPWRPGGCGWRRG